VQSTDLSVVIEEPKVKGEEDGEQGLQLRPQHMWLTRPLYVASFSEHEKRQAEIISCNNSDFAHGVSDQRQSCEGSGVSTAASNISSIIASIGLDRFFEAEGFIFNK
jgi:hypothetical protein